MNLSHLSNDALMARLASIGKEMTAASSPRNNAMEKDRMIYVKEAEKRHLLGNMKSKRKFRES